MCQKTVKLLVFTLIFYSFMSFALESDRSKVMHGDADTVDFDQATHKGVYAGHVVFTQGTTHLEAAKVLTEGNEKNEITLAIAEGDSEKQAHFSTKTHLDKPLLHAYANIIRYFPQKNLIELEGNASVKQGNNVLNAPKILYDTVKQHVITKQTNQQRTSIVFHPEKKT